MKRPAPHRPTDTELRILSVLWNRGPSTVREVHEELMVSKAVGYTTALKMLQVMTEKGLVVRDDARRPHRFRAARARAATQRQLLRDLMDRAFGGSASALVLHAIADPRLSATDRAEIERLLSESESESEFESESEGER